MWGSHAGFESGYGGAGGYTQSPGGFASPSGTQGEKKLRSRSQNIIPCTVSQLLSAEQVDDAFRVRDVEISQVIIVGIIRHAEKAPTNILYKVDDMTAAPMDVRQWVDTDEVGSENVVVPPGTYVKVAGHLRSFQNKKSLVAFKIMPLEDMNEFTTHMLEIINAHMILRKGNMVLNLIKSCASTEGISLSDLNSQLHGMSLPTVKKLVEFLSSEGHIYSTIDDEHFKSTDAE
ncbi:hypothetical protein lerEdw1_009855 [Lerista edwardsae]|nr:hypothetical protein lerEdw1_009855 [Lerista edwardsae]